MEYRDIFLPGAKLTEGLQRGGRHVAESSVVTQQQESQHLKSSHKPLKHYVMLDNFQLYFHTYFSYRYIKKKTKRNKNNNSQQIH